MIKKYFNQLPQNLIGWSVRVPSKSNFLSHWWVTVIDQRGQYIKVGENKSAGKSWWTHRDLISRGHFLSK